MMFELETPRLLLRKLRLDDAADMYEYAQDREIALNGLWLPFVSLQESIDDLTETLELYATRNLLDWAIEHRQDRKMIGRMGLHAYHTLDQRAELGYAFNRTYWGHGYATEAAKRLLEYGFNSLNLHRISATVLPDNAASIRVLEKLGMIREGVHRDGIAIRGKHEDLLCYSVLRPEYLSYNQPDAQHNPIAHS